MLYPEAGLPVQPDWAVGVFMSSDKDTSNKKIVRRDKNKAITHKIFPFLAGVVLLLLGCTFCRHYLHQSRWTDLCLTIFVLYCRSQMFPNSYGYFFFTFIREWSIEDSTSVIGLFFILIEKKKYKNSLFGITKS